MEKENQSNLLLLVSHFISPIIKKQSLEKYLNHLYNSLSSIDSSNLTECIPMVIFHKMMQLPLILSKNIYRAFTSNETQNLCKEDFIKGFTSLYEGTIEERVSIIFSLCDLNNNGLICSVDIELLLKYLHFHHSTNSINEDNSFEYIQTMLSNIFSIESSMNKTQFIEELKANSDIMVLLLIFLEQYKPFSEENMIFNEKEQNRDKDSYDWSSLGESSQVLFSYVNKRFNEDLIYYQRKRHNSIDSLDKFEEDLQEIISCNSSMSTSIIGGPSKKNSMLLQSPNIRTRTSSPLKGMKISLLSPEHIVKSVNSSNILNTFYNDAVPLEMKQIEGFIEINGKVARVSMKYINKDMVIFRNKQVHQIINMSNYHISIDEKTNQDEPTNMYAITFNPLYSVYLPIHTILCNKNISIISYVDNIKKIINQRHIDHHYEFLDEIYKGPTSSLFKGKSINNKHSKFIAIKVISKKLQGQDKAIIEMIETEAEIHHLLLKCKHNNIINSIDLFESSNYYFIINEYAPLGTLTKYMEDNSISEVSKFNSLLQQITNAISFLHSFGIIHRDIKTDNILISKEDNQPILKLNDFGLSKIIGFTETTDEPCGSLMYTAPEILARIPYNHKVDIWSVGILSYFIWYHLFPFSHKDNNMGIIASKIRLGKYSYPNYQDDNNIKQFISLCLEQDHNKRIIETGLLNY